MRLIEIFSLAGGFLVVFALPLILALRSRLTEARIGWTVVGSMVVFMLVLIEADAIWRGRASPTRLVFGDAFVLLGFGLLWLFAFGAAKACRKLTRRAVG